MKFSSLFLFCGLIGMTSLANAKDCFTHHVKESLNINQDHKKTYAKQTQGQSDKVINRLMMSEVLTLTPAAYYDLQAKKYHQAGVPLFCDEFVSLTKVSESDSQRRSTDINFFKIFDWKKHKENVIAAIKTKDQELVKKATSSALNELKSMPEFYCMTRHMFESVYRFAHFVPLRKKQSQIAGVKDPTDLMFNVMRLHLAGIGGAHKIDLMAMPMQAKGIALLCSEIPDILKDLNVSERLLN